MMSSRRCPYCNSTAVVGLGAFIDAKHTAVELRCGECGRLFVGEDRRDTANAYQSSIEQQFLEDV